MISRIREWAYQRRLLRPVELPAFVLSVGNISLGGTGKSAFVMLLAEWAAARGIATAVLSRGYKRKSRALKIVASGEHPPDAAEIGDEPWMIKHRVPAISLLVHPARAQKAKRHWKDLGSPRLVLLDDAFQHWRCARDYDVLMVDATESLEQRTLPFGRLRETVLAVRRADLIVITRARSMEAAALAHLEDRLREASVPRAKPVWKRATRSEARILLADYSCSGFLDAVTGARCQAQPEREYLLVSGIAKPDSLREVVKRTGLRVVEEIYFPDHHRLTERDRSGIVEALRRLRNGCLLITEKDWGRWRELFSNSVPGLVINVKFEFLGSGSDELAAFFREVGEGAGCSTLP